MNKKNIKLEYEYWSIMPSANLHLVAVSIDWSDKYDNTTCLDDN